MTYYAWTIDTDHLDDDKNTVRGPRGATIELLETLAKGEGESFRIYDDDNVLYYAGRILGDYDGFEPLDDFGTPNAGATEIRYRKHGNHDGAWESL